MTVLFGKGSITTAEQREQLGPERPKINTLPRHHTWGLVPPSLYSVQFSKTHRLLHTLLHVLLHIAGFGRKREGHTHTLSAVPFY